MEQKFLRNVAIIAHVDHGKTTLVDKLFEQSGMFGEREIRTERLMDSMEIEKERGITIAAKNGTLHYRDHCINIIDTPGHADFGGQVERVLRMADGVLLLVDAQEGPMPQTFFVLKKALKFRLPIITVINKIDKPAARPDWVVDQVFDLFVKLDAPNELLDFPIVYSSAKNGYSMLDYNVQGTSMRPLLDMIIERIPMPGGSAEEPLQMLVSSLDYSPFLGRLAIGKITSGRMNINAPIAVIDRDGNSKPARISKIYRFVKNEKVPTQEAICGEIVAVAGFDDITVGVTYTDPQNPCPLPPMEIDPPTISMNFIPNDSPFAGKEGEFVTSRHIGDRLKREVLSDVALKIEDLTDRVGFKVSGRGELHLSILIETMRREGYELQVTRPQVIYKESEKGHKLEPWEELTIDVDPQYQGAVISKLGERKGLMVSMEPTEGKMTRLVYHIPTRGLLGYRSEFMTDTCGMGIMNYIFHDYLPFAGEIKNRHNGAMIVKENNCVSLAYPLGNLQERGTLFIGPGVECYMGMILGEHCRENDIIVNPAKGKKLTNMRASGSDDAVILTPHRVMDLEDCIDWINDDEIVEITPKSIRMRKMNGYGNNV
ncbi:MAG: translational GTPase TypA [Chitinispirillales bacterium]|jgi:GTP-binding protein|nr:translational GTPase TypA [Chitinispirillales bacterium]